MKHLTPQEKINRTNSKIEKYMFYSFSVGVAILLFFQFGLDISGKKSSKIDITTAENGIKLTSYEFTSFFFLIIGFVLLIIRFRKEISGFWNRLRGKK